MKTGVRFYETKYLVNEEKKTVVCILEATFNGIEIEVNVPIYINVSYSHFKKKFGFIPIDTVKFVGVAKCSPDDIFDVEKGKRIAESRAKSKAFAKAIKINKYILSKIEPVVGRYHNLLMANIYTKGNESNHLEELSK